MGSTLGHYCVKSYKIFSNEHKRKLYFVIILNSLCHNLFLMKQKMFVHSKKYSVKSNGLSKGAIR